MIHTLKKIIAVLLLGATLSPVFVAAQSVSDLQAQITILIQRVQQLQTQLYQFQHGGTGQFCFNFNNNLGIGSTGGDVGSLVTALSHEGLLNYPNSTVNLAFDETVASAVSAFQEKYRSDILVPSGLSAGTGYVGVQTRAKLNALYGCSGTVNPPTSSAVSVSYLQQTSGPVGTQVTVVGNGFTSTGNRIIFGTTGTENNPSYNLNSSDGHTLVFTVPSTNFYACQFSVPACYPANMQVQLGTYTVSVMNGNGTSNAATFTVTLQGTAPVVTPVYGAPTISYISPTSGGRGTEVTIVGSNFTPNDSVQFSDSGTYMAHNYVDSTKLTFTVPSSLTNCNLSGTACTNVYPTVTNGAYNIRVINNSGTSNAASFTVTGY